MNRTYGFVGSALLAFTFFVSFISASLAEGGMQMGGKSMAPRNSAPANSMKGTKMPVGIQRPQKIDTMRGGMANMSTGPMNMMGKNEGPPIRYEVRNATNRQIQRHEDVHGYPNENEWNNDHNGATLSLQYEHESKASGADGVNGQVRSNELPGT